ncbi:MAG: hypothetical protein ACYC1Q_10315, partial [Bacteroidia bacterium]
MKWVTIREITPDTAKWYLQLKDVVEKTVEALAFNDKNQGTNSSAKEVLDTVVKELTRWNLREGTKSKKIANLNLRILYNELSIAQVRRGSGPSVLLFEVHLNLDEGS